MRATMDWFWGIWIGIVRNNIVRAAATTAFRATDIIVKVSIDSYLGHVAKKRYQAVGFPCNRMLKLSSSRGIRIDLPVLSVSWSFEDHSVICLLYTSPSPRDRQKSRMPSSA